jgi:hypothetical protein
LKGRDLVITTNTTKEKWSHRFRTWIRRKMFCHTRIDTDELGTLEVERKRWPYNDSGNKPASHEVNKLWFGYSEVKVPLVPTPSIFYVHAMTNFTIYGQKKQLEIIVREISMETNFQAPRLLVKRTELSLSTKLTFHPMNPRRNDTDFMKLKKALHGEN